MLNSKNLNLKKIEKFAPTGPRTTRTRTVAGSAATRLALTLSLGGGFSGIMIIPVFRSRCRGPCNTASDCRAQAGNPVCSANGCCSYIT